MVRHAPAVTAFLAAALWLAPGAPVDAQTPLWTHAFAGSETENRLRALQLIGVVPLHPWGVRGFSQRELDRLAPSEPHPFSGDFSAAGEEGRGLRLGWVPPRLNAWYNTGVPAGSNNGPVWEGRGLTVAGQVGAAARLGPLSVVLAPQAFWAENRAFELVETSPFLSPFASPDHGGSIDLPQRFGDGAYARLDPGQSTVRLDLPRVTVGASTANQYWGPARHHPIILGNNAPGFQHVFAGTSEPWNLLLGRGHGRLVWGRLEQSSYSPMPDSLGSRFMAGMAATFQPRGVPGLEVGGSRFFHLHWPDDGLTREHLFKPLEAFFKGTLRHARPDTTTRDEPALLTNNQLASAFFRWVFPGSGWEVYGEYGKEDHNFDARDMLLQPDHGAGYMIGFQRAWRDDAGRLSMLSGEILNLQVTHIALTREQYSFYGHSRINQGHTQRGQLLGAAWGRGGAASTLRFSRLHEGGAWELEWQRELRREAPRFLSHGPEEVGAEVWHRFGAIRTLRAGRGTTTFGAELLLALNQRFEGGGAAVRLYTSFTGRPRWRAQRRPGDAEAGPP